MFWEIDCKYQQNHAEKAKIGKILPQFTKNSPKICKIVQNKPFFGCKTPVLLRKTVKMEIWEARSVSMEDPFTRYDFPVLTIFWLFLGLFGPKNRKQNIDFSPKNRKKSREAVCILRACRNIPPWYERCDIVFRANARNYVRFPRRTPLHGDVLGGMGWGWQRKIYRRCGSSDSTGGKGGKGWGDGGNFTSGALSYRPPPPPHRRRRHTATLPPSHRKTRVVGRRKVYFPLEGVCVGGGLRAGMAKKNGLWAKKAQIFRVSFFYQW